MPRFLTPALLFLAVRCLAEPVSSLHVKVSMRDGVRLCANVFRPGATGRFPAVLQRTPYKKVAELTPGLKAFIDHGYAVVTQDVRGRNDSEGEFRQFVEESADGEDTLSWIAHQPWSDGRVAMFGGSYVGISQWRVALTGHPALKAIAPAVAGGDDYYDRFYSRGGAFKLAHRLRWIAENYTPPARPLADFQRMVTFLPLRRADSFATGRTIDFYQTAMDHPSYNGYWKSLSTIAHLDRVKVPALIESGWYDNFAQSDLEMWSSLRAAGKFARIIIGPWGHNLSPEMPGADFGPQASLPLRRLEIEWFDAWVKGAVAPPEPAVHYFLLGANQWRESPVWPPEKTAPTPLYLASRKGANSLNGDGALGWSPPARNGSDHFNYDPRKAVPTVGGAVCCNAKILPWGPLDQRAVEGRKDVLVYSSPPLQEDVEVAGPIRAALYVSSSVPDTDFTAKLVDVFPDGRARILCDGIVRMRYRQGVERAVRYEPGKVERVEIDLGVTANLFKAGHRIRLDVASSNFPRFDRNLNTGRPAADDKELRPAQQTVHHGLKRASLLLLPVVKR